MKKVLFILFLLAACFSSFAHHIKGGFFTYQYLGRGIADTNAVRYNITLTVYMACELEDSANQVNDPIYFTIFHTATNLQFALVPVHVKTQYKLDKLTDDPCINNDPVGCYYRIVIYELDSYELPVTSDGYTFSYQRCCRIDQMENIINPGAVGTTYTIKIPGSASPAPNAIHNSSPVFPINDTIVLCENKFFTYPFTATDIDGDSLSYSFCTAYTGATASQPAPNVSNPPPYTPVPYVSPYSGTSPLGASVSINPVTGLVSGVAPGFTAAGNGEYVITVCISEYRNRIFFAETRKELHVLVRDCTPLIAKLNPIPTTCDGFTLHFTNAASNPAGTLYAWNFGDTASGILNSSTLEAPSHVYSDTGVYPLTLIVSIGGACSDSAKIPIKVYPGFFPGFIALAPLCKGSPVQFQDTSHTKYGSITGWQWNFGNTATLNDTSHLQNPAYTYTLAGSYDVQFIVANTFGCIDTIVHTLSIAETPTIKVTPHDTLICALDTISISAISNGSISWLPNNHILNANSSTPSVFPPVSTTYIATANLNGCISRDSVNVIAKNDLVDSIFASATSICAEDTLTLTGHSNYATHLSWTWTPSNWVQQPNAQVTSAFPMTSTLFNLTAHWGNHCMANTSQLIIVKPLALPEAGPGGNICKGEQSIQLNASGGDAYQWSPSAGLNNPSISNPVAAPLATTTYYVHVFVNGCSKAKTDSVQVVVFPLPPIQLIHDTLICSIDTVQLTATGSGNFTWSPNYQISNIHVNNPFFSPDVPTQYQVSLTDQLGCINTDSVFIDVKTFVSVNAGNDTTICLGDTIHINTNSDALHYLWSPSTYLDHDTAKQPLAAPLLPSITYHVIANIGKCQSQDDVTIRTVPYPKPFAGKDTSICSGTSAYLQATGGNAYHWSPPDYLTNTDIPNPVVLQPLNSQYYVVTVTDIKGCPKPSSDTVFVDVVPPVIAQASPHDTTIVIDQPLTLHASGGNSYLWSPSSTLADPTDPNTSAFPKEDITYWLTAFYKGCSGTDSVHVRVYLLPPSMYVPNAFSPNQDGDNDVFKPVMIGMKSLSYFKVFNRWGELIFSTTTIGEGWDGTFKGKPQDIGTYVWMAQGISYKNEKITKKGYVVLIR